MLQFGSGRSGESLAQQGRQHIVPCGIDDRFMCEDGVGKDGPRNEQQKEAE